MASEPPTIKITRIACFRFKPEVSAEKKGDRTRAFLALYKANEDLLVAMPRGGRLLNTPQNLTKLKKDSLWDTGFTVTFKSELARNKFDDDPGHDKLKNETDPLLEEVLVYDIKEEENLGW